MLNSNLTRLFEIAQKPEKIAIGLMSGTSLDGLDIALCRFTGSGLQTSYQLLQFTTHAYPDAFKQEIREVFSKKNVSLEKLCLLNACVSTYHAELVLQALKGWNVNPGQVDYIASHGQTIYHAPKRLHQYNVYPNATLQIGDGDHMAVKTGILTISDFRQKHVAAGGEGAPLALYGDVILGSKPGEARILLNLGGIANLTYLPADGNDSKIVCTDIGPGNTIIDAACKKYFNKAFDEDAAIAYSGQLNNELLYALLDHPFFKEQTPKTTGPELFNLQYLEAAQQRSGAIGITPTNIITTLSAFTARTIAMFIKTNFPDTDARIFVSGGGARNPYIINHLKQELPQSLIQNSDSLGINADAKEAILFALLGNEALSGEPLVIGSNPAVLMGKFSFPL